MRRLAPAAAALALFLGLPGASAGPPKGLEKWALLVGVNDYAGGVRDNVGAVGDVQVLREALVRHGFPDSHIRILTDRDATAEAIRDGMRWLRARADHDNAYAVFHYSGHIKQAAADDGDSESKDELLWGADNRYIADGELGAWARAVRGWLWVDVAGCEAAGLDDGVSGGGRRLFTGSSAETEKSYEHPAWKNSVMTGLMVEQGMLGRAADYDKDGAVSIHEAWRFAAIAAPEMTKNQKYGAQHPYLAGDRYAWFLDGPGVAAKAPAKPKPPPKPVKKTRKVVLDYAGPSARSPLDGACPHGCFTLSRRSEEAYVKVSVKDASGRSVAVGGPFGVRCSMPRSARLGSSRTVVIYLPVDPSCGGAPTRGTITVLFSNLP